MTCVTTPWSYLLCGTPRTGSTFLCSLLTSTGVAGRPESYFREPDERAWATTFGLAVAADGVIDYRSFVAAARRAGSTTNGVFAARIMWGTMDLVTDRLRGIRHGAHDLDVLTEAFGPLRFVHLRRVDDVGQAVSWARAEQTGYWQQGDEASTEPAIDLGRVDELIDVIGAHNSAWDVWFEQNGVRPHRVTYEDLTAEPDHTVREILNHLDLVLPTDGGPESQHRKQADAINAEWVRRFRSAHR